MEQRDLIKDQIEQIGRVLGKILADFLGLKSKGQITKGIDVSNEQLKSELDIDIDKLIGLSKNELKVYLQNRKLTEVHLEILSDIVIEISVSKIGKEYAKTNLEKSLEILEIADEISKTMSFDRINKKTKIENALQQKLYDNAP